MKFSTVISLILFMLFSSCYNSIESKTEIVGNVYHFANETALKKVFNPSQCYIEKIGTDTPFSGTIIIDNIREATYTNGLLLKEVVFNNDSNLNFDTEVFEYEYEDEFIKNPIYTTTLKDLEVDQIRKTNITLYNDGEVVE